MRTPQEIELAFKAALKSAADQFIGFSYSKQILSKVQAAVTDASTKFFDELSDEEIEQYEIQRPTPRVVIRGNEVSVESY